MTRFFTLLLCLLSVAGLAYSQQCADAPYTFTGANKAQLCLFAKDFIRFAKNTPAIQAAKAVPLPDAGVDVKTIIDSGSPVLYLVE